MTYVAAVPMRLLEADWVATQGTPPGQPQRLPEPCVVCSARTPWRVCPPRAFEPSDEIPLCPSCQDRGGLDDLERDWRRRGTRICARRRRDRVDKRLCALRRPV